MADHKTPEAAFEWQHIIPKDGYTIYQSGSHKLGNFIQVFAPDTPYRDAEGKLKLIAYLHGFALCLPKFYQEHLECLAKQGYYVVFPDFQKSQYPDELANKIREEKAPLSFWFDILTDVISKWNKFKIEETLQQYRRKKIGPIVRKLVKPTPFKYLRLSLALIALILVIRLFNRRYGKNLIQLISTVAFSLVHSPVEWVKQAIGLTEAAWKKLGQDIAHIAEDDFDFYVFGHSLGGLLALSWPLYIEENQQKFLPKQIITADPAPSTDMGIPLTAISILKLFRVPFAVQPINIAKIGNKLGDIPIGIMHGADDAIVKPQFWLKPSFGQKKSYFDCIGSKQKKIYFSLSNKECSPPLLAFHNQAVTDTTYFEDAFFNKFGGVKKQPNIYNFQYIWLGLDLVVKNQADVNQLLDKFNQPGSPLVVTDTLPEKPTDFTKIAIALLVGLILLGLGYWFWQYYTPV